MNDRSSLFDNPHNPLADELAAAGTHIPDAPKYYEELRGILRRLPAPRLAALLPARAGDAFGTASPQQVGAGGVATGLQGDPIGQGSGSALGILPQLFYGQSNVLTDPALDDYQLPANVVGPAFNVTGSWFAKYALNSGIIPGTCTSYINYLRDDDANNPFNSNDCELHLTNFGGNACDVDFLIQSGLWAPANIPGNAGPSIVVAAMRIASLVATAVTFSTCTVSLRLVDAAGVVLAESPSINWLTFVANTERQLSVSVAHVRFAQYRLQLRVHVVSTAGAEGNVNVDFGEPQLGFSSTQSPGPYTPLISSWEPTRLIHTGADLRTPLIDARKVGDTVGRLVVDDSGIFTWGSGAATRDVRIARSAAGELKQDSNGQAFTSKHLLEATAGQRALSGIRVAGDTVDRLQLSGDATVQGVAFGPGGATALDVRIQRSGVKTASFDDGAGGAATLDMLTSTLLLPSGKLRLPSGTGALTATESYEQWNNSRRFLAIYDSVRERPVSEIGWLPFADLYGFRPDLVVGSITALAAGTGIATHVYLTAPISLQSVTIRNVDATLSRSWEWRLYEDRLNNTGTLNEVAGANGSESSVAAAAANRTANAVSAPVIIPPGHYWLVIRNTEAANVFSIGGAGTGTMALNVSQTKAAVGALGATLDLVTGWTKGTSFVAGRLNGRALGGAAAW
jgi:hypothetical protein